MKKEDMEALVDLLAKAGIEFEKAEKLVERIVKIARRKHFSVLNTLLGYADAGAGSDSMRYQLYIALQSVSRRELIKLTQSKST